MMVMPPAPLCPGVPWGLPWERRRRGTSLTRTRVWDVGSNKILGTNNSANNSGASVSVSRF
jgi:hypothetical protein